MLMGFLTLRFRYGISERILGFYRRLGIDIPADKYSKQFVLVGIILLILGFLVATDLIDYI